MYQGVIGVPQTNGVAGGFVPQPYSPAYYNPSVPSSLYPQVQTPARPTTYQQPNYISSRLIKSLDEITPQEVPMDGSVSLFPMEDYSCVYAKAWNRDGTIRTVKYVPEKQEEVTQDSITGFAGADVLNDILENIADLTQDVNDIKDMLKPKTSVSRTNKTTSTSKE